MDAVKFIKERNRMCKSFDGGCKGCPAFNACEDEPCCAVGQESTLGATAQIVIVEDWSTAHPRKTRLDVFLEQHAEEKLNANEVLDLCPITSDVYEYGSDHCNNPDRSCGLCRREFWMQEVE